MTEDVFGKCSLGPKNGQSSLTDHFLSRDKDVAFYPPLRFNDTKAMVKAEHENLNMILDSKLNIRDKIREAMLLASNGTGIIYRASRKGPLFGKA